MLAGPADTGKTWASCTKAHAVCCRVPKTQGAFVRKTASSLAGTVVRTFERLTEKSGLRFYGGESPSRIIYPNGSQIWLGGMDNPDRVLSSERDFIYVNQAEELSLNDWETLATRCSGRAAVVRDPQLFGDCNPAGSRHWIRERAQKGSLRLLNAKHKDNPTIFNKDGELTKEGARRLAVLERLTGVRRKRLLEGIWATAEGAVYDMFDAAVHVCQRNPMEFRRFYLTLDEGYTNPAVILLVGSDADERWHVFREYYETGVLQEHVVQLSRDWYLEPFPGIRIRCSDVAVDAAAAGLIADLVNAGVPARGGKGRVLDGIQRIQNRLKVLLDGKPRLTMDPSCVNLINEFESYAWKPEKDMPAKEHDHALDALRYLGDMLAEPTGAFVAEKLIVPQQQIPEEIVYDTSPIEIFDDFETCA